MYYDREIDFKGKGKKMHYTLFNITHFLNHTYNTVTYYTNVQSPFKRENMYINPIFYSVIEYYVFHD